MGLFDKVRKKDNGEETTAAVTATGLELSEATEPPIAVASGPETPVSPSEDGGGTSSDEQEQPAVAEGGLAVDRDLEQLGQEQLEDALPDGGALDLEDEPEADPESDDGDGDELMDIFTGEEEEDVDLSALTDSLDDIEIKALLTEASEVSDRLKAHVGQDR